MLVVEDNRATREAVVDSLELLNCRTFALHCLQITKL